MPSNVCMRNSNEDQYANRANSLRPGCNAVLGTCWRGAYPPFPKVDGWKTIATAINNQSINLAT